MRRCKTRSRLPPCYKSIGTALYARALSMVKKLRRLTMGIAARETLMDAA
jgi:hypothetical protein